MRAKSDCEQYLFSYELIADPKRDELSLQEAVGHLEECPECKERWELIQNLDKIIEDNLRQTALPPALHNRIMENLTGCRMPDIAQAIYETVCAQPSHLPLRTVFSCISARFPQITLSGVRHNLNWLVGKRKLLKLDFGEGFRRYDGNTKPHPHFFCQKCRLVLDLPALNEAELARLNIQGHKVSHTCLVMQGICRDCLPAH